MPDNQEQAWADLLDERLKTLSDLPFVIWPNGREDKATENASGTDVTPRFEVTFSELDPEVLAQSGTQRRRMVYQVNIVEASGDFQWRVLGFVGALRALFPYNLSLGQGLIVTKAPARSASYNYRQEYYTPVPVMLHAFD